MEIEKLLSASEVLGEISNNFQSMPEGQNDSIVAALHIEMARTYLVELAAQLAKGTDPYDAMLITAQGLTEM